MNSEQQAAPNPYESPEATDVTPIDSPKADRESLVALWILGPILVATATAVLAGLVSLTVVTLLSWNVDFAAHHADMPPKPAMIVVLAAFVGITSLLPSVLLGLTATAAVGIKRAPLRQIAAVVNVLAGALTCAIVGASIGFCLLFVRTSSAPAGHVFGQWMGVPAGIGLVAGALYALLLVTVIRHASGTR